MEIIYTELSLYGSKNECARTDTVFNPISLVCDYLLSINNEYLVKMTYIPLKDLCQNV